MRNKSNDPSMGSRILLDPAYQLLRLIDALLLGLNQFLSLQHFKVTRKFGCSLALWLGGGHSSIIYQFKDFRS